MTLAANRHIMAGAGAGPVYAGFSSTIDIASAITATLPAGVVAGTLLIATMNIADFTAPGAKTWTGGTGWTELLDQNARPNLRVAYKVAGSGEANPTFTHTGTDGDSYACVSIWAFNRAAYDTIGTIATSTDNGTISYNSITSAGGIVIAVIASGEDTATPTYGTPSGFTAQAQVNYGRAHQRGYYKAFAAGSVSGLSSTISGFSGSYNSGVLIGVKAA